MELLAKKRISKIEDVVGNKIQIKRIVEHINTASTGVLAIIGPDGCGKTTFARLAFEINKIQALDVHNKESMAIMKMFLSNKTIESFTCKKKKAIFVDNIEVLMSTDKGLLALLDECMASCPPHIVVVCCNYGAEKQLSEFFKKKLEVVKVNYPSVRDTYIYLSALLDSEKIAYDDEKLLETINKHRGSIRDSMINLEQSKHELDETATINTFKDYNNFEITKAMFAKPHTVDQITSINADTGMLSFLIYENLPEELYHNYGAKFIDSYENLNRYYVMANILENHMYSTMDWSVFTNIQYLKLVGFNTVLSSLARKKTTKDIKYRFSQVLSKLSHKNIMNKRLQSACAENMGISPLDVLMLCDIADPKKKHDKDESNVLNTYDKYFPTKV